MILVGCASKQRKTLGQYRQHLEKQRWKKAIKVAKSSAFYNNKRSQLLKWMEQGMLHHLQGDYLPSQKFFDRAIKLSNDLYTVSISKKNSQGSGQ